MQSDDANQRGISLLRAARSGRDDRGPAAVSGRDGDGGLTRRSFLAGAAALVGGMLSIKPVVGVVDGDVVVLGKARGSKQSKNMVFQKIDEAGGIDFTRPIWVAYSGLSDATARKYIADSLAQAKAAEEAAADEFAAPDDLPLTQVGAVIGTHVGPGGVAFAFFARE